MDNKRRYSRVTTHFDVVLQNDSGESVTGTLCDVAMQGAFVTCEPAWPLGTIVAVTITLHGGIDDIRVSATAEVVRRDDTGLGVHFTEIDVESVGHLRNIITYNADDPDVVWEELHGGPDPNDAVFTP